VDHAQQPAGETRFARTRPRAVGVLQRGERSEGNLVRTVTPHALGHGESLGAAAELDEHDPRRPTEGGKPACGSRAHRGAGTNAAHELDGYGGEQQGMPTAPLQDAVEHHVLGIVAVGDLHPDVVTQRVRDAAGLTLSVYAGEAEEVAAVVIEALRCAARVDRAKLRGKGEQQLVKLRARLARNARESARTLHAQDRGRGTLAPSGAACRARASRSSSSRS